MVISKPFAIGRLEVTVDQFEAFRRLHEAHGLGAEEIAARFSVTPAVVRQRLRLGPPAPS